MKIEDILISSIKHTVESLFGIVPEDKMVMIEIPKDNSNGDYSTNIAMRLTKLLKRRPQEIAGLITEDLLKNVPEIERIEVAGPGFIIFWIR